LRLLLRTHLFWLCRTTAFLLILSRYARVNSESPCTGRTAAIYAAAQNVEDLLTMDSEDWNMGGMTTVTLKDRRIDRQHSRAGQSAGIVATRPGALEGWRIALGWVEFFKDVGAGTP